jgi:hypothetical protein
MKKFFFRSAVLAACLALLAGAAAARDRDDHRGKDRDRFERRDRDHDRARVIAAARERERARELARARERERVRVLERERARRRWELAHRAAGRPPGWSKGRKTGWGNCDLPPGQAKKYGCTPAPVRPSARRRPLPWPGLNHPAATQPTPSSPGIAPRPQATPQTRANLARVFGAKPQPAQKRKLADVLAPKTERH